MPKNFSDVFYIFAVRLWLIGFGLTFEAVTSLKQSTGLNCWLRAIIPSSWACIITIEEWVSGSILCCGGHCLHLQAQFCTFLIPAMLGSKTNGLLASPPSLACICTWMGARAITQGVLWLWIYWSAISLWSQIERWSILSLCVCCLEVFDPWDDKVVLKVYVMIMD